MLVPPPQRLKFGAPALVIAGLLITCLGCGSGNAALVKVAGGPVALTHVRVIDGTGGPTKEDQTIVIENGRIREMGDADAVNTTGVAQTIELRGRTVIPGMVGMHDHLFYAFPPGSEYRGMPSFPRLYLATGVTSARTAGATDLTAELQVKKLIESGRELGPHLYLTSPYVDPDPSSPENPAGYSAIIEKLMDKNINSVKIYTNARRSEVDAVIRTAHRRGVQVTGHLCAVGFSEAAELGIDNLEHGLIVDTEFYSRRQPDVCPEWTLVVEELLRMDVRGPEIQALIKTLVAHQVAITSTLAVFESMSGARIPNLDGRALPLLAPALQTAYLAKQKLVARVPDVIWGAMLKKEMAFERAFVEAGGLLLAGVDPTGWGGVLAGFGDQHGLELLVEAGFTPEQAIRIATYNGALFLKQADRIGTLAGGKEADLVVIRGNPSASISDIRQTEIVFKDGVGYDSAAMLRTLVGQVGRQ